MNDVLVLYKSKYGATKKYVDMLKKELDCDVYEMNTYNEKNLEIYRDYFGGYFCRPIDQGHIAVFNHGHSSVIRRGMGFGAGTIFNGICL